MLSRGKSKLGYMGIFLSLILTMPLTSVYGYYGVGDTIDQQTRNRTVIYCANGSGTETVGSLLNPGAGEPTRVLWFSFFASW